MEQGKLSGLLPIFVFLLLFIGSGVLFADFYRTPAIVAFLLAFLVAFLQNNKQSMGEKLVLATRSMGQEISLSNRQRKRKSFFFRALALASRWAFFL